MIRNKPARFLGLALLVAMCSISSNAMSQEDCCHFKVSEKHVSVDEFLESCDVTGKTAYGSPPYFDCQSYILGVVDSFKSPSKTVGSKQQLCIPNGLETKDLLEVVWNDYRNIKEEDYDKMIAPVSAANFIYSALKKKFSCHQKNETK